MYLALIKHAFRKLGDVPDDVTLYFVWHFYVPLRHAANETLLINACYQDQFCRSYNERLCKDASSIVALVNNPLMRLDPSIKDGRIAKYIELIGLGLERGVLDVRDVTPMLYRGMEEGYLYAFKLLYERGLHDLFPGKVAAFVKRTSRTISKMRTWDHLNAEAAPLIRYCLDMKWEEPLLEWLIIWPLKGSNICKSAHKNGPQQAQYEILYAKCRSPELAPVRRAVIRGHGYIRA